MYQVYGGSRNRHERPNRQSQADNIVYLHTSSSAGRGKRHNRSFDIYRFFFFLIFALIVAFLCGICFGSFLSNAESAQDKALDTFKYYRSITVESGDSLWNIAQENITEEYDSVQDYIEEVCFINSITADDIHAGHHLIIPYYEAEFR